MPRINNMDFELQDLPEEINGGGEQLIAVRKFPGGGLDIQQLGAFDDPVSWQGTFMFIDDKGNTAVYRAQQIDALRIKGDPIILQYSSVSFKAIITSFKYHYRNDYQVDYQIEVQPLTSYDRSTSGVSERTKSFAENSDETVITATRTPTQATSTPQKTYRTVSGDTLWNIAIKFYKNPSKWTDIAKANNIKNPKGLKPGTKLIIP